MIVTPLALVVVALKPFIHLRFGNMRSNRFGHFCADPEVYLLSKSNDTQGDRIIDVIGCPEPVCNLQIKRMWSRTFRITPGAWLWAAIDRALRFWTRGPSYRVPLYSLLHDYSKLLSAPPCLSFTDDEARLGQRLQQQLGIPLGARWICIHNRDEAFLDQTIGGNWAYHSYRNFSVQSVLLAAEELSRRGYFVIRIGSHAAERFSSTNPRIIDYAFSHLRSDFLDIFLMANCTAYIGSDSGVSSGPLIFRKPVYFINFSLTGIHGLTHFSPWPFITKHLVYKETQRPLSLRQMFEAGLYGVGESWKFEKAGVEVISNTQEEIRDLVIEVDERLRGRWQPKPEDEELQQRFWDIVRRYASPKMGDVKARIGAEFLRKHQYLLS